MSSTYVFTMQAFRLPPEVHPHFVVLFEQSASSNVYSSKGSLVRRWSARAFGTPETVLVAALTNAAGCEGGMVKLDGKSCRPEAFYSRAEKAVGAATINPLGWSMRIQLEPRVTLEPHARQSLIEGEELLTAGERWGGLRGEVYLESSAKWLAFVQTHPEVTAWDVAEWGRPYPKR